MRLGRVHVVIQLRIPTRIWYLCVKIILSYGERVNFGRESMGIPDLYVVVRGYLLLFPRPNILDMCSGNSDWNM